MLSYTKELLRSLHLFPSNHLFSWNTKAKIINLDTKSMLQQQVTSHPTGKVEEEEECLKTCKSAKTITTNPLRRSSVTQNSSGVNFKNLQTVTKSNDHLQQSRGTKAGTTIANVNVRSLVPKAKFVKHYLTEKDIDVYAVTETWMNKDTTQETLKATIPDGYTISSQPRKDGCRGRGLALPYKKESTALIDVTFFEAECSMFKIRIS